MTKLGKPMLAALLAVVGFAAVANAEPTSGRSYGSYSIRTVDAPVILTQPAVVAPATCPAVTTIVAPATTCAPATTLLAPATRVVAAPMLCERELVQAAIMLPATGFSMDPNALRLYTGPRFENTLTMPDANTYLRP